MKKLSYLNKEYQSNAKTLSQHLISSEGQGL